MAHQLTADERSVLQVLRAGPLGAIFLGESMQQAVLSLAARVLVCDPHRQGGGMFTRITEEGQQALMDAERDAPGCGAPSSWGWTGTPEQLDEARANEAMRLSAEAGHALITGRSVGRIAARLAREEWMPPIPPEAQRGLDDAWRVVDACGGGHSPADQASGYGAAYDRALDVACQAIQVIGGKPS